MMDTAYFSAADHRLLAERSALDCPLVMEKAVELQHTLARRVRDLSWDLHGYWDRPSVIPGRSAACTGAIYGLSIPFLRSREQALTVERMMGRDGVSAPAAVDWHNHPALEVRLTPEYVTVELVLPPTAWWDQRNLVGKLSVARHREALRSILNRMDSDICLGFWEGVELADMHLTHLQLLRGGALVELMNTFGDGHDWLRVGAWYEPEDARLDAGLIVSEIITRMSALYPLYHFLLWSSNNNFQSFHPANAWMLHGGEAQA